MRVDALSLLANKTVARIADKVVPCGRAFSTEVLSAATPVFFAYYMLQTSNEYH